MKTKEVIMLGAGFAAALAVAQAQFVPIPLTPDSFNHDIVVEKEATPPAARNTTATFDGGTNNTSNTLYEMGFNRNAGAEASGIPAPGTVVTKPNDVAGAEHVFQLPASYTANNAFFIDSTVLNTTINLTTPAPFATLSLLGTSGGGAGVLRYEITFADDTKEIGAANITVPDWYNGTDVVITANGRVNVASRTFDTVNGNNPRVYNIDIPLTETTKAVKSIYLERVSGGRVGIFAVSGATAAGGAFAPVAVSGYTYDMIVEAAGDQFRDLRPFTTATMDGGANNNANTWYEVGYNAAAPTTGLAAAGSTITSEAFPDHTYTMAASYAAPNALLISSLIPAGTITPATPVNASALSFLAASGNGAITFNITVTHQDGSTQVSPITVPDWFNGPNAALVTRGRVNTDNATFNNVNGTNPRIYSIDTAINNTVSPITKIDIAWVSGTGRTVVMALSRTAGSVRPLFGLEPVSFTRAAGGSGTLDTTVTGTAPFTFQWEKLVNGTWVPVQNSATIAGATSEDLVFSNVTRAEFGDYRLTASNVAGTTSSRTVRVNVVSTRADLSIPGDIVTLIGGSAPTGEAVGNAIDDTPAKYLNFGLNAVEPPFEGPVGLQIEFVERAVVNGLRVYTANDGTERDPVGYTLLGSNDPFASAESFVTVSTGNLSLPLDRNANPTPPVTIDPLTMANQEIDVSNGTGYLIYRLLFNSVRDNAAANSVQIGEVEFLGEFGAGRPQLSVTRNADSTITITSSMPGTLQSTTSLNEPIQWGNDQPIDGSVTVPTTGAGVPAMQFFRVIQ